MTSAAADRLSSRHDPEIHEGGLECSTSQHVYFASFIDSALFMINNLHYPTEGIHFSCIYKRDSRRIRLPCPLDLIANCIEEAASAFIDWRTVTLLERLGSLLHS